MNKILLILYIIVPFLLFSHSLKYLPNLGSINSAFNSDYNSFNSDTNVEIVFKVKKSEIKNFSMLSLLNDFIEISDMEGIEYYSSNRNKRMPLINESYYINNKNKKISDISLKNLPEYHKSRIFQHDTTFYGNYYSIETRTNSDTIWIQLENLEDLRVFGLFKALEKGKERMNFIIKDSGTEIILYAMAQVKDAPKVNKIFNIPINIPGAFRNRAKVIIDWYINKITN